jgi:hypothetical protein
MDIGHTILKTALGGAAFSRANLFGRDKNVALPGLAAACFRKPP